MHVEKNLVTQIEGGIIFVIFVMLIVIVGLLYIDSANYKSFVNKCNYINGNVDLENHFICWKGKDKYIYKDNGFYISN